VDLLVAIALDPPPEQPATASFSVPTTAPEQPAGRKLAALCDRRGGWLRRPRRPPDLSQGSAASRREHPWRRLRSRRPCRAVADPAASPSAGEIIFRVEIGCRGPHRELRRPPFWTLVNVGVDKPRGTQTCFGIRTAQPLGQPGIVWMHRPPARHHDPGPVGGTRWTSAWAPKGSTPNWSQSMHVRRRRTPSPTRWAKLDRASTAGPGPGPTPGRRLPPGGQHQRGGRGFGLLPPTR